MEPTTETFPIDWTAWRKAWTAWREAHKAELRPTSFRFTGRNFLADEVLGTWSINGRNVELSEVTFTIGETRRYVGITFGTGAGSDRPDQPIVETFGELERELGL